MLHLHKDLEKSHDWLRSYNEVVAKTTLVLAW